MATCDRCGRRNIVNGHYMARHRDVCDRVPTPQELAQLRENGASVPELAEQYGVSKEWMYRRSRLAKATPSPTGTPCGRCGICEGEYGPLTVTVTGGMCNLCEVELAAKARRERVQAQMAGPYPRSERGAALQGVM